MIKEFEIMSEEQVGKVLVQAKTRADELGLKTVLLAPKEMSSHWADATITHISQLQNLLSNTAGRAAD